MPNILSNIPIILVIVIILTVIYNLRLKKSTRAQAELEAAFLERERQANETRKQDVSGLPYISIPAEIIPQEAESESARKLAELADKQILNLTGISNTDLKLQYGIANLEFLSGCDNRFTELVAALDAYSSELMEQNRLEEAEAILSYAVSVNADNKAIYVRLAKLYADTNRSDLIAGLMESAGELNSISKDGILSELKALS